MIDAPVRKPIPKKDPFDCDKKTRKKHPFLGFLVLLMLISSLMPLLRDWGLKLEEMANRPAAMITAQPEPEYFHIPDSALELYQEAGVTVLALWPQDQAFFWDFPIYVRNESDRDITVTAQELQVNGYRMESSTLWCETSAGTPGMGMFFLSQQDRFNTGILAIQKVSFRLELYDHENYETIALSPLITLTTELPEGTPLMKEFEGTPVVDQDGLRITYLGFSYPVSAYDPYSFENGALLFHIENETGKDLEISLSERSLGDTAALGAFCTLPHGAKAVVSAYTYPLPELGITQPEQLPELNFTLNAWECGSYEDFLYIESLIIPKSS